MELKSAAKPNVLDGHEKDKEFHLCQASRQMKIPPFMEETLSARCHKEGGVLVVKAPKI